MALSVTITGTGFTAGSTVSFGTTPATSVTVTNPTTLVATSPAGIAGAVDVTVTTAGGTTATSPADLFTYDTIPAVTAIAPSEVPLAGGTLVAITGTEFTAGSTVNFGSTPATLGHRRQPHHPRRHLAGRAGRAGGRHRHHRRRHQCHLGLPTCSPMTASRPSPASPRPRARSPAAPPSPSPAPASPPARRSTSAPFRPQSVSFTDATTLVATSPAGSTGSVDVTVTSAGGTTSHLGLRPVHL